MARKPSSVITLAAVVDHLDALAPPHLAEAWDNVGLLLGDPAAPLRGIHLAIDLTAAVADELAASNANFLVVYHPPIFKPVKRLVANGNDPASLVARLALAGTAVYSPHTALDVADPGTNEALAAVFNATVTGSFSHTTGQGTYLKLVTFIPEADVEKVADALFNAGAGHIGGKAKYTRCSFRTPGTGTFFGDDGTNPAVGTRGHTERVPEIRLETILPTSHTGDVINALRDAHPYEEPAFDLLKMETPPEAVGLGRTAKLAKPTTLRQLALLGKKKLGTPAAQFIGDPATPVATIALLAGSAGRIPLEAHAQKPFDCLITGELKHHDLLAYHAAGIPVILLGHPATERPVLDQLRAGLTQAFAGVPVSISRDLLQATSV